MANEYYDHTTYPATGSPRSSAGLRGELDAIEVGFNKLPTLSGNGSRIVRVNAAANALEAMTGGAVDWFLGANIASAATINLTTATGNGVHVTGGVAITAVTLGSGMWRLVIFDAALTLTHHATNNNLPGGANIVTAAGDRALYWSDGATVYCVAYIPASGSPAVPFVDSNPVVKGSVDPTKQIRFEVDGLTTAVIRILTAPDANLTLAGIDINQTFTKAQRGNALAVGYAASVALDFNTSNNFVIGTLTGNITLANPTNVVAGQSGLIVMTQDGTGSRTLTLGTNFKKEGGVAIALTTTPGAVDYLSYWAETATRIYVTAIKDVK